MALPPPERSDEMLVQASLQGDKKSLEQLVARYRDLIFNIALKMIQDREEAADITQEVLIKVITKLDGFKYNSAFKTWVYRITVNQVLNYKKSTHIRKRFTFRQYGETLDGAPDEELTADDRYGADNGLL